LSSSFIACRLLSKRKTFFLRDFQDYGLKTLKEEKGTKKKGTNLTDLFEKQAQKK
jgi:hypothetical protein